MKIASLVVRIRPGTDQSVRERLLDIAGVEVHDLTPDGGRLLVTVEDGEGYSTADSVLAVTQTQGVLGTTLAYEFTDDTDEETSLLAVKDNSAKGTGQWCRDGETAA